MIFHDPDDAVGTQIRLRTTPIVDGRTQWMSLSAAIDNPSNREPYLCTYSMLQVASCHQTRTPYTVMDQKWSGVRACEAHHCALTALTWHMPSLTTHAWPGQAGWPPMAATLGMDWTAGAKSISENERSRDAATYQ